MLTEEEMTLKNERLESFIGAFDQGPLSCPREKAASEKWDVVRPVQAPRPFGVLQTLRKLVMLNMLKLSSSTLRKAAGIQEEIEKLDFELRNLLAEAKPEDGREAKNLIGSRVSMQIKKSRPSTGVAAGVRQILKARGKAMKVGEIYKRLVAAGYSFRSSNPKNSLTAQMYRMRGVRRIGPGEFRAA